MPHHYYINIPLEHHSPISWLAALKQFIQQETTLAQPALLHAHISSEYDHCGLEIPASSAVFRIQQELYCALNVHVVVL